MKIVETVPEVRALTDVFRQRGLRVGLVPTMGYLHQGHLSLVAESRGCCDVTVVSIFVNPVQFGANEDLDAYPRDLERDCGLCRNAGVDVVFFPAVADMYAPDRSFQIEENLLSKGLCGASRPGHFPGVCTVVAKLFNIVQPDVAVFGQKDAQQLALIRRMVRDLDIPVKIVGAPIVREPNGLAMSSRNLYLSEEERQQALGLNRALSLAVAAVKAGQRSVRVLRAELDIFFRADYCGVQVEYIAFVDSDRLQPVQEAAPGTLLALAARVGKTRLIDNVRLP